MVGGMYGVVCGVEGNGDHARYDADESSDDELVGEYTHVTMQV